MSWYFDENIILPQNLYDWYKHDSAARRIMILYNRIYGNRNGNYSNRRKAVSCHPFRGQYTLSSYIAGEAYMTPTERKSTILPCGFTVAATWAGLRKAWLGFEIANSKGDFGRKVKYAKIIRKLQSELGIPQTTFDFEINDSENLDKDTTKCVYRHNVDKDRDSCIYKNRGEVYNTKAPSEKSLNYDQMMQETRSKLKGNLVRSNPRHDIFDSHKKTFENPCNYTAPRMTNTKRPTFQGSMPPLEKNCRYVKPQESPVAPPKPAGLDRQDKNKGTYFYYVNPNYRIGSYRRTGYENYRNREDGLGERPRSAKKRSRRLSCIYKRNESYY